MSPTRSLLCLVLVGTALAQGTGIRLKARLDWSENDAITKKGRWHPVQVEVQNLSGTDIEGKVWIEVEVGNGRVQDLRYQRPLALPRDARKRFVLDVRLNGDESSVFVHADLGGFAAIRAIPILWVDDDVDPVLVVGTWPKAYLIRLERKGPGPNGEEYFPKRHATLADPEDFPDTWRGLDGVETIVWDGVEMGELSVAQAQAVEDWVEMGGSLVLSGGGAIESYYKSPLGRLLPGRYAGRVEVDVGAELARKVGLAAPRGSEKLLAARIDGVESPLWATRDQVPLLVERPVGLGRICVVPFDLPCDQVMGAKGADLLLDYLVGHRGFSVVRSVGALESRLPGSFKHAPGVRVPPAGQIAVFLGLYVLACLGNLLLWRAAHRREFAWATLLALSLGFAGYAWRDASLNAQAAPSAQHVTVIELGPEGRGGRQMSWFGFFTSIAMDVEVAASSPREALTMPGSTRTAPIGGSEVAVTEDGRAPRIPELALLPRSVSCVKTERAAPPEVAVTVRARAAGDGIVVEVVPPDLGTPLTPVLVHGDNAIPLGVPIEGKGFRGLLPPANLPNRLQPLNELATRLTQNGLAKEMAGAILTALSARARNGDPSWLVVPLLGAPARIRWAGEDVVVERGVTLVLVPMRWEGCLGREPRSLTPFCRGTPCEKGDDYQVWELTPLWRDGPGVVGSNRTRPFSLSYLDWRTGAWVDATLSAGAYHPFTRAIRARIAVVGGWRSWIRDHVPPPPDLFPR